MNHTKIWTVIALITGFVGVPTIGRTETAQVLNSNKPQEQVADALKVGEIQSQGVNATVTEIHSHQVNGKSAATLYIRNIPVITFIGSPASPDTTEATKVGVVGETGNANTPNANTSSANTPSSNQLAGIQVEDKSGNDNDPIARASAVAARINELVRANADATKIAVNWKAPTPENTANKALDTQPAASERYEITAGGQKVVEIDQNTRLAGSTNSLSKDALQATNRLRRLIGGAEPISEITDLPKSTEVGGITLPQPAEQIALRPVRSTILGIASFYWQGQRTATGERYNPHGLTAAHRSLPFGTRVRVTNKNNGRSVIVRINDRGPFIRGRVIDLSLGAAKAIGMVGRGLAPVKVEVLGR